MTLQEYEERVDFIVYDGGYRVMLPAELDLAIKRLTIAELQDDLERFVNEPKSPELVELERKLPSLDGKEYDRALLRLSDHEERRNAEWRALQNAIWRAQHQLGKMEKISDGGGDVMGERYRMREFSHAERLEADDKFTNVDPETHERTIDTTQRNLYLLKKVLKARINDDDKEEKVEDPAKLQDRVVQTLIERMWARNTMAPELAGFFR